MLRIEGLEKRHQRSDFDCGEQALNHYLQTLARQQQDKGISKTFVLIDLDEPDQVLGFFSLVACDVLSEHMPLALARKYPARVPGAKLARLAVARQYQGKGYGQLQLIEAMRKALQAAENIGIIGFFVDAKNASAGAFYEQYGFIAFPDKPLEMFLPMQTLCQTLAGYSAS